MKNVNKTVITGFVVASMLVAVLLVGHNVEADAGDVLTRIVDKAGYYLARIIASGVEVTEQPVTRPSGVLGGAGDLFSIKKIASIGVTTNVRTTTITNSTSVDWVMDKIFFYASSTPGGFIQATPTIHIAVVTSTAHWTEVTVLGGFGGNLGWITSTPFKLSTSTFAGTALGGYTRPNVILKAGNSLVIVNGDTTMTTTEGVAGLEYYSL